MRQTYRWDANRKELVRVIPRRSDSLHFIQPDIAPYESPVTGNIIDGRRARREDLKRNRCRPYEGREQELKEANKIVAERERKMDVLAEKMAHTAWANAPESVRKVFRGK